MKKVLLIATLAIFLAGCVFASGDTIEINDIDFKIPAKYQGGELNNGKYELDNLFSIRCVDDNVPKAIGLWAEEQDSSEDIEIGNHPVRHFSQYNEYVHGNQSHAYFVSDESVYEIAWAGAEINKDIEDLINNTPDSKIGNEDFYGALDESYSIYKLQKIDKLNRDAEYNYLESKYDSQYKHQKSPDDTRFKQILYTYYLNK